MSDEESFVILGSCSPGHSLDINESLRNSFQSLEISKIEKKCIDESQPSLENGDKDEKNFDSTKIQNTPNFSYDGLEQNIGNVEEAVETLQEALVNDDSKNVVDENLDRSVESKQSVPLQTGTSISRSTGSGASADASLAASFIMGEVNAEVLKSSVYSQFPSLSLEASHEDVIKLRNFMSEYIELKGTLAKVNGTMRVFYEKTQQWREEMQRTEEKYKQQLQNCQTQIAMLRNENLELKRDIEGKLEHLKVADEIKKNETAGLIQLISEKSALVENLRSQIDNLETKSLVFISKAGHDTAPSTDYIPRSEHIVAMKEMDRKMSELLAENLELKDMQKIYIDEINYLKVNLTAAEELHQQSRKDIDFLKAKDIEKCERFTQYETERDKMREEISLLRQQVDVYSKDFQMERTARESLAGEKDKLLQDIRAMQRANQQLIEDQKRQLDNALYANVSTNTTSTGDGDNASNQALPKSSPSNGFCCPVCGNGFQSLTILQGHVNSCLDNS